MRKNKRNIQKDKGLATTASPVTTSDSEASVAAATEPSGEVSLSDATVLSDDASSAATEPVYHIPALLRQSVDALDIRPDGVYVDVTLGGGGHTREILRRLGPKGQLYSFDRDTDAIATAPMDDERFTMILGNFRYLLCHLQYQGLELDAPQGSVDGILADLGVSFHHFDDVERGFTFRDDSAPLDMRMTRTATLTAADILNTYEPSALADIFRLYGEVNRAGAVASAVVRARGVAPLQTSGDLLRAVTPLLNPARARKELAQVYQALRIVVNDEMSALRHLLRDSLRVLRPGGRLAVITYHSLEDRLVKNFMRSGNFEGKIAKDIFGNIIAPLRPVSSKAVAPDDDEIERNPRSRSAHLRAAIYTPIEDYR